MKKENYEFFSVHEKELVSNHYNRYALIAKGDLVKVFDSENDAIAYAVNEYKPGEYIVHHCIPEKDQEMMFYSRVRFSSHA